MMISQTKISIKKHLYLLALAICSTAGWIGNANALMVIDNVGYSSNSVSFSISGDMTGYANIPGQNYGFGIVYSGAIWNGIGGYTPNSWNTSVFDNISLSVAGNTGSFGSNYSWSWYSQDLATGVATNRNIVLTMGDNYLNTAATSGGFDIIWGHDLVQPTNVLYSYNVAAVPEPETYAMLLAGLGLLGFTARRRKNFTA